MGLKDRDYFLNFVDKEILLLVDSMISSKSPGLLVAGLGFQTSPPKFCVLFATCDLTKTR